MNSFMRAYNKNRQSLHDYIHQLFESYSRLLVIRLDLSYKTSGVMEWLGNPLEESKDSDRRSITVDDVIAHREQFIEHLREKFGKALKGYVWKLEYGSRKGYHYHTIVFLDGAKYREGCDNRQKPGELLDGTDHGQHRPLFQLQCRKNPLQKLCSGHAQSQ